MAELNVVRKKKSPLPWILLALIVLAILAFLLLRNNNAVPDAVGNGSDTSISYEREQTP